MPVVPIAIMAGGAIISHFAAKKATSDAMQRSPEELAAQGGASAGAASLQKSGTEGIATGAETQKPATSYFDTLLRGNRAQQAQATAAPTARITDVYSGAERGLEKSGVRGAARDVASADLTRNKAGAIAGLVSGVQPAAANALTSIGQTQQAQGASMVASGNNTYSGLLGMGQQNRQKANEAGTSAASSIGQLATGASKVYSDWYSGGAQG